MTQDIQSLQPWQIFCSMFAVFWLVTAWLDQVLITLVLCIVFGVVSDIVTKNMYSDSQEDGQTAVKEKKEVIKELSVEEIKANNEKIWSQAEAEKEKEDEAAGVPPPLPSRDYQSGQDMDLLAEKLSAVAASSEAADSSDEEEEEVKEEVSGARQYNRTVSDEYNQNTSTIDFNQREAVIEEEVTVNETIDEDPVEAEEGNKVYAKDSSDEEEEEKKLYAKDSSDEEEKKVYAKDSSDEDDYDYASREVNFDEDESETEEDDTEGSKKEDTTSVRNDEMQVTENKTLKETNDFMEDKKDGLNVNKEDLLTQDAMHEIENEPKKESTTIQDLKDYLMEDKTDSLNVVNNGTQGAMQEGNELKLDESKKEEKDDMLSSFEDLKPEMKSVDDLVTF